VSATYAVGFSEHPLAAHGIGEAIGQIADTLDGQSVSAAVVFVTAPHIDEFDNLVGTIMQSLQPDALVAVTAVAVLGGGREAEEVPAVSVWAASGVDAVPLRFEVLRGPEGPIVTGLDPLDGAVGQLVLLTDPFTFPTDVLIQELLQRAPELLVVGGMASAARGPGGNRLSLNGTTSTTGAVALLLPGSPGAESGCSTIVSQGCRPVGSPFTVTAARDNHILELGGEPAIQRLNAMAKDASPEERELMQRGLHVGFVINEQKLDFDRGDFLIRGVMGFERETGAVVVGDRIPVGAIVQFQVRDAATADEDLHDLMSTQDAQSALVFTCNGRGVGLFGEPNHDAGVITEALDGAPIAGMFCAGEIGPVGGRNFLHGFTASILLFDG